MVRKVLFFLRRCIPVVGMSALAACGHRGMTTDPSHSAGAIDTTYLIEARKVYTVTQGVIEDGAVLVENGKISAVGRGLIAPGGARTLKVYAVMPGMIDVHTHIGLEGTHNFYEPHQAIIPSLRIADGFDYFSEDLRIPMRAGVTTVLVRPGSNSVIDGSSIAIKLKQAQPGQMLIKEVADIKMAVRQGNQLFVEPGHPAWATLSPDGFYASVSQALREAQDYQKTWEAYRSERAAGKQVPAPARDLNKETLVKALQREIPVHIHCTGLQALEACIRLKDEFNLRLTLGHASLAANVVDQLRERTDIDFNVGPGLFSADIADSPYFKNKAAILANAGLKVSLQTDGDSRDVAYLGHSAALCVRYGMKAEHAMLAVTLRGAQAAGLEDRIGSLDVGKDADLVLLDGEPFELATAVEAVMIDGKIEYQKTAAAQRAAPIVAAEAQGSLQVPPGMDYSHFAIRGATVLTMAGAAIANGTVLIENGKIVGIGTNLELPEAMPVIDARGFYVMPGLVTPRTDAGLTDDPKADLSGDPFSEILAPHRTVAADIVPDFFNFLQLREIGVTSGLVMPGDASVIGGQGFGLKMTDAPLIEKRIGDASVMMINLTRSAVRPNVFPETTAGIANLLRQTFIRAQEYRDAHAAGRATKPDPMLAALVPVLNRQRPVMIHGEMSWEILAALSIIDEFKLDATLVGAMEAYKVVGEIKRRNIPVVLGSIGEAIGRKSYRPDTAAVLAAAGISVALKARTAGHRGMSVAGFWGGDPLEIAALAYRYGLPEQKALLAVTLEAARIAGIDKRVGSLEVGKDADILVLRGHPLRTRSIAEWVLIDGKPVFQATPDLRTTLGS